MPGEMTRGRRFLLPGDAVKNSAANQRNLEATGYNVKSGKRLNDGELIHAYGLSLARAGAAAFARLPRSTSKPPHRLAQLVR